MNQGGSAIVPTHVIEARSLVKTYGEVRALDDLSIAVVPGIVFGLLGPNGAGKSTTIKILTTLTRLDAGFAEVAGIDVLRRPDAVRRAIGCVAQKPGFDPDATGRENLMLQGRLHGLRDLKARCAELLDRFDLAEVADRLARTYSGGMRRKLDLAIGLVHRPRVLFLDEPTTGLDPQARAELWAEIARLASGEGVTVLLTTHYLEEADRLASQLAIVDHGRVVIAGSPEQLKSSLRGDAITVELTDEPVDGLVTAALSRVAGLAGIGVDGRLVRARAESGSAALPAVLAALDTAGVPVGSATIARPSLDDVYLRHAGRAFRASEEEELVS
jgi:ABC-2 type transport system ATP-binding protein